ncbi:hypothetical protein [Runella slithyformis]|uniref:Uncharacterized protein n=1 Tax=Runella slithyformis (strain ATCC 29530 / DSM 19594 / LMG 11500 / NCIMB 11436 / LSU 4) TaxID=761193 RepID=A0A7U3ZI41_RUNSL|nr:hypothetical protein [Runella slithyformis]AEI47644.1 hypothetical protein Runsl_1216 [Runella slithyformis DSM 19594]
MALHEENSVAYLYIFNGRIAQRVDHPTDKTVSRTNKNGQRIHERYYGAVQGMLTNIELESGDYGKQWLLSLQDGLDKYTLRLGYSSRIAKSIFCRLPNAALDEFITVIAWKDKDDKEASVIRHGSANIPMKYTKDNPNGLPPMVKTVVDGKDVWNDTDQMKFLESLVLETIVPKLHRLHGRPKAKEVPAQATTSESSFQAFDATTGNGDDAPF